MLKQIITVRKSAETYNVKKTDVFVPCNVVDNYKTEFCSVVANCAATIESFDYLRKIKSIKSRLNKYINANTSADLKKQDELNVLLQETRKAYTVFLKACENDEISVDTDIEKIGNDGDIQAVIIACLQINKFPAEIRFRGLEIMYDYAMRSYDTLPHVFEAFTNEDSKFLKKYKDAVKKWVQKYFPSIDGKYKKRTINVSSKMALETLSALYGNTNTTSQGIKLTKRRPMTWVRELFNLTYYYDFGHVAPEKCNDQKEFIVF